MVPATETQFVPTKHHSNISTDMAQNNNRQGFMASLKCFWNKHLILCNAALIIISVPLLIILANIFLAFWTHHGDTTVVPNVRDMEYQQAIGVLEDADLGYVISDSVYDLSKRPGQVVDIFPKPGAVVKSGREVYLTIVSFSPQQIVLDVPVDGQSVKQAEAYLKALGIKNIHIIRVPSPYPDLVLKVKAGNRVLSLGSRIPVNATITLEVGQVETPVYSTSSTLDSVIDSIIDIEADEANETGAYDSPSAVPAEPINDPVYE